METHTLEQAVGAFIDQTGKMIGCPPSPTDETPTPKIKKAARTLAGPWPISAMKTAPAAIAPKRKRPTKVDATVSVSKTRKPAPRRARAAKAPKAARAAKPAKAKGEWKPVCRYCGSKDLAPSFIKRHDARCRKCFSDRYGSAAKAKKAKRAKK